MCEREADRGVEQETEEEEALLEPEAEPELEPVPEVSRDDSDVHSQNWAGGGAEEAAEVREGARRELKRGRALVTVEVASAAGASLPKEATVSFTDGVDVWRAKEDGQTNGIDAFREPGAPPSQRGRGFGCRAHLPLLSLRGVRQEAGVDVLQVGAAGADGGDAQGVAAVPPSPLVGSEVRVVKRLGVRARGAAAAGLRQLPAGHRETTGSFSD